MNPEERMLLERSLKLAEENNHLLRKINRRARWAFVWGVIKIALVVVLLVIGYMLLQPYFGDVKENYRGIQELFNSYQNLPR
mgnify:CR=1 FL=1